VILHLLQTEAALPPGRVVLLGTPLANAAAAARVAALDGADGAFSRSLESLGPQWDFVGRDIGAIAGTLDTHLGVLHPDLERPNDGAVAVSETRVTGLADHIELAATHAELVTSREVIDQTVRFLTHGAFGRRRQQLRRELAG
ncbi:MAG: alpha/beta hydrolase, partial [Pseudomonadota bacterium]